MEIELARQIKELIEEDALIEILMTLMIEHQDAFNALKEVIDDHI